MGNYVSASWDYLNYSKISLGDCIEYETAQACAGKKDCSRKYKVVVAGTAGVGKTTLRGILSGERFRSARKKTYGYNGTHLSFPFQGETFHLCVYDTAAIGNNQAFVYSVLEETDCLILAYAVDDQDSLDVIIENWLPEIMKREDARGIKCICILGTKADLRRSASFDWKVNTDPVKLAGTYNAKVLINECSSMTGENVKDFFWELVKGISKHVPVRHS